MEGSNSNFLSRYVQIGNKIVGGQGPTYKGMIELTWVNVAI